MDAKCFTCAVRDSEKPVKTKKFTAQMAQHTYPAKTNHFISTVYDKQSTWLICQEEIIEFRILRAKQKCDHTHYRPDKVWIKPTISCGAANMIKPTAGKHKGNAN